jgi:PAS domain S-box-containing protein
MVDARFIRSKWEQREMAPKNQLKSQSAKAPRSAKERVTKPGRTAASANETDTLRLIQELEVREIELKLQLEQLRQYNRELEANHKLYESVPVGYLTLGLQGDIENINLMGASMLGQPRAWLLNRRFARFVAPESLPCFDKFMHRVRSGYERENCTVTLMKGGDTPVVACIEAISVGPDSSFRALVVDITSAEQARRALREREVHLQLALAASDMGVWEWERETGDIYWSPECIKIFGVDCLSPALDTLAQLLHPEDAPRVRSTLNQMLAGGKEQSIECRIVRPDSEVVWILARGQVQFDRAGTALRLIGIVQNITERRRTKEAACPWPAKMIHCRELKTAALADNLPASNS